MAAHRRNDFNSNDIINQYIAGKSVKKIASDFGFSRQVVYRVLRENSIHIRDRSESMYVRMAQTSPEERKRLAEAAHIAKRGRANTPEMLHKRALAQKRFIGIFEQEFIDAITASGIEVIPQFPFLSYNLDICCGNIAVEIDTQGGIPTHNPRKLKRIVECLHGGMNMIYVALPNKCTSVPDACYEQVISLIKECRTNPPTRCQYWVIRRTGEIHSTGSFDFDNLPEV